MKGVVVKGMEMPCCCSECIFNGDIQDLYVGDGLYKKISRCKIVDVEDPWRNVFEQTKNRADYCPLEELKNQ